MRHPSHALVLGLFFAALTGTASPADAQGIGGRILQKAKDKVEQRAEEQGDKTLDRISCVVTDEKCIQKAEASGKQVTLTDAQGSVVGHSAAEAAKPGSGAWANYDFVPGERVIFAEDFSKDRVGNFPRRLEFVGGIAEVVAAGGARYLRASGESRIAVNLPEALPQRFTIEYDITIPENWESLLYLGEGGTGPNAATAACCSAPAAVVFVSSGEVGLRRDGETVPTKRDIADLVGPDRVGRFIRVRVHVDGKYAKVYVNETRVANVPNVEIPRTNKLYFDLNAQVDAPMLLGNLSINAGGREMYDALMADGRFTTQGILFDTGSDRLRPESTPTLKEIGAMLEEHPDLRIRIEGHTDNVGQAAANQALSEKRAAAVRAYLEKELKIDGGRLQAQGLGDKKPVSTNETAEGRQNNRRVELVKL